MLVLSRAEGQKIYLETLNGPVVLAVVEIRYGKVRLGIDAPLSVQIKRDDAVNDQRSPKRS